MSGKFLKFFTLLLLVSALFVACEKDNIVPLEDDPVIENSSQLNLLAQTESTGCYELTFPITFSYEDGTTATAENEDDLEDIFSSEPFPVDVEFPIFLTDPETGETATANNEEELAGFFANCEFEDDDDDGGVYCDSIDVDAGFLFCYDIVFPLTFELEDGSTVTAETEDDLFSIFDENNPPVDFVYPITLENLDDGEQVTANDEEELGDLLDDCEDFGGGWDDDDDDGGIYCDSIDVDEGFFFCYDIVFPITFELEDGNTVTAENEEDLFAVFDENNPPVGFVFPITLEGLEDGEQVTANNEEELGDLIEDCGDFGGGWDDDDDDDYPGMDPSFLFCYDLVFPISVELADGSTVSVENQEGLFALFNENNPPVDFVYPITLASLEDGEQYTVNDEEELDDLLEDCEGFGGDNDCDDTDIDNGSLGCYEFVFPISFQLVDGSTATAESEDDLEGIFFSNNPPLDFAYPINLEHTDTGESQTANSAEELGALLEEC